MSGPLIPVLVLPVVPAPAPACAGALVLVDRDTRRVLMPRGEGGWDLKISSGGSLVDGVV